MLVPVCFEQVLPKLALDWRRDHKYSIYCHHCAVATSLFRVSKCRWEYLKCDGTVTACHCVLCSGSTAVVLWKPPPPSGSLLPDLVLVLTSTFNIILFIWLCGAAHSYHQPLKNRQWIQWQIQRLYLTVEFAQISLVFTQTWLCYLDQKMAVKPLDKYCMTDWAKMAFKFCLVICSHRLSGRWVLPYAIANNELPGVADTERDATVR